MKPDTELRAELVSIEARRRWIRKELRKRKRARLGLPAKRKGNETYWRKGHEYLVGRVAHALRRLEVYKNAGGDAHIFDLDNPDLADDFKTGMCQGCAETHEVSWYEGEWHHNVKTLGGRRCDCAACGLWVCSAWHKRYHGRTVRSGKVSV